MPRIFDGQATADMVNAVSGLRSPLYTEGRLTNILVCITTLDDPYYMRISAEAYKATLVRRGVVVTHA